MIRENRLVLVGNHRRRELLYLVYFILVFITVRVWIIAIETKDVFIISFCGLTTFLVFMVFVIRQRRAIRIRRRQQELIRMNIDSMISETNRINELNRESLITPAMLDSFKCYSYSKARSNDHDSESNTSTNPIQHPHMSTDETNRDVCIICLANYQEEDMILELPCTHSYHKNCISEWLRTCREPGRTLHAQGPCCPLCKSDVVFGVNSTDSINHQSSINHLIVRTAADVHDDSNSTEGPESRIQQRLSDFV